MAKKSKKRVKRIARDKIETEEGKRSLLVSGLPPELTKDEALTIGVLKLFVKDIEEKTKKINKLEIKLEMISNENSSLQEENAVLKIKKEYSFFWDILIGIACISGGGVITFWESYRNLALLCFFTTGILFWIVITARKK